MVIKAYWIDEIIGFMLPSMLIVNSRREYMVIEKYQGDIPQSRRDYM